MYEKPYKTVFPLPLGEGEPPIL